MNDDKIAETTFFELDFKENWIGLFKAGDVKFLPDNEFYLLLVNKGDGTKPKSILKVWYEGVNKKIDLKITNAFLASSGDNTSQFELCPSQNSILMVDTTSHSAFTFSYEVHEKTMVKVPLLFDESTLKKGDLLVEKVICPQNQQFF